MFVLATIIQTGQFLSADIFCPLFVLGMCYIISMKKEKNQTTSTTDQGSNMTNQEINIETVTAEIYASMPMVTRFFLGKTRNMANAEDAAMNGIVKALENIEKYNGKSKVSTWVCTVAYRLWLDSVRSHGNSKTTYTGDNVFLENVGGYYEMEEFGNGLDNSVITEALDKLSDAHKQVLTLHYIEGLKYREIAERIGKPIGTVMSRINQAKAKLKGNNALVAMMKQ